MGVEQAGGIGSAAVQKATGRSWDEWFALLDADGAQALPHSEIAVLVRDRFGASDWWSQSVTVAYEQARGLRAKHQMVDGYAISLSKTVNVPVEILWRAWSNDEIRLRWLPDAPLAIRKATEPKSVRFSWDGGASSIDAEFYAKGEAKSRVSIQHSRLPGPEAAAALKPYWSEALARLKQILEGG